MSARHCGDTLNALSRPIKVVVNAEPSFPMLGRHFLHHRKGQAYAARGDSLCVAAALSLPQPDRAVEIAVHAEMANHICLIVRARPDLSNGWSDEQVVRQWLSIAKLKRNGSDSIEPTWAEVDRETQQNAPGAATKPKLPYTGSGRSNRCDGRGRGIAIPIIVIKLSRASD
uniref:Uncharacterized protein n=1 Tax=uncultured bacterium FLS18 TaxID=654935 RepID=C6G407_9BACT|nr:hypothetical protein [uncultured bacterium FLS18]